MSTTESKTGQTYESRGENGSSATELASPFTSPDERIAALEARIKEDRLRSRAEAVQVEDALARRKRSRERRRHAWQFIAGLVLGIGATLLVSASIDDRAAYQPPGAEALAASLGVEYVGAPFECKPVGGGFECFQPTATGGTTLQVRLDYRGCWEAKPNSTDDVATAASGCIGAAAKPGGSPRKPAA
jgi:hypothetical protein